MREKTCRCCNAIKLLDYFRAGRNKCMQCECVKRCQRYKSNKERNRAKLREEFIKEHPKMGLTPDGILEVFFDKEEKFKWIFLYEETFNRMMNDLKDNWVAEKNLII